MTVENPSVKSCWAACSACHRCADKGKWESCATCSGRHDPFHRMYPDPDDTCRCREGVLSWKTQQGRRIVAKYPGNPFRGGVQIEKETADERDYKTYLQAERERRNDANWSPVTMGDGSSADSWYDRYKHGAF